MRYIFRNIMLGLVLLVALSAAAQSQQSAAQAQSQQSVQQVQPQQSQQVQPQQAQVELSLGEVIFRAREGSIDAMLARHTFLGSYWEYMAHRANLLPSLTLTGSLPSFDRSLSSLQDANTGEYRYLQNYVMRNNLGLNLKQNIGLTGGSVSLFSGLERMDQFSPQRTVNYNSAPVSVILSQPIGAFNKLKWDKKIEPLKYEQAKFIYLESMERVVNRAVTLFFELIIAQQNLDMSTQNRANTDKLYQISRQRFELGAITHSDLLQLELRLLNEGIATNENQLLLNLATARLSSYLDYPERTAIKLVVPHDIPQTQISLDKAYSLATENSSFAYRQQIQQMEAEKAVAQAKALRNPQIDLYARFGLNQTSPNLSGAYGNMLDQETVRLGVSIPIFDGGMARGRLKMSRSQQDVMEATLEKEAIDQRQEIYLKVMQFNNQQQQCQIALRADSISAHRYELSIEQFAAGRLSVLELNNAQSERDQANSRLMAELYNYWEYYYSIQRMTLYDFLTGSNISTDFDELVQ